jgi:type I restriction enzyme M protein
MVALPGQLFTNTQIPACIWFLTKNKKARTAASGRELRDRSGEVLFIDARNLGYMKDRVLRDFTPEDLNKVTDTFHNWQITSPLSEGEDLGEGESVYQDEAGFCKSVKLADIQKHDYVLTPGRYVGAVAEEDDGEEFSDKMRRLTSQLSEQFIESQSLSVQISNSLSSLGYPVMKEK